MEINLLNTEVFAVIVPSSPSACDTMNLRRNLQFVDCEMNIFPPSAMLKDRRILKLDFPSILARRCFSFGSSRASDYQLPKSEDVSPQQFIIFFDLRDLKLYFKDTSRNGTWVTNDHSSTETHMWKTSLLASSSMHIRFGGDNRFDFHLFLNQPPANSKFHAHLSNYVSSIQRTPAISLSQSAPATSHNGDSNDKGAQQAVVGQC
jgi:hypothetical protein